jgi:hypothetical protein
MILSVLKYLLQTVNPSTSLYYKLHKLLNEFPLIDPAAMGFPAGWADEPLWQVQAQNP